MIDLFSLNIGFIRAVCPPSRVPQAPKEQAEDAGGGGGGGGGRGGYSSGGYGGGGYGGGETRRLARRGLQAVMTAAGSGA